MMRISTLRVRLSLAVVPILLLAPSVISLSSPHLDPATTTRRGFLQQTIEEVSSVGATITGTATVASAMLVLIDRPELAVAAASSTNVASDGGIDTSLSALSSQVQQARRQLDSVPKLIEAEQWDAIRNILIEPPLADCWAKTSRPLITKYAEGLGDNGGDELAALEAREDLVSHLRYLDMAVYNNIFNPITVEGKSGATKELIRSYYEDPINELKASTGALDELISLAGGL